MQHNLNDIVSVVNFKGGVGKTTTVQSLAACIRKMHPRWRVLCIDLDPQCNLSYLLKWPKYSMELPENERKTIFDSLRNKSELGVYCSEDGIYYVPGSEDMQNIDTDLMRDNIPARVLGKCFLRGYRDYSGTILHDKGNGSVFDDFDIMLIDCPPALSLSTNNAIACSTTMIIPVQMETLSVLGTMNIVNRAISIKEDINKDLENVYLLPVMVDGRLKIMKDFGDYLDSKFPGKFLDKYTIRKTIKVTEAQAEQFSIIERYPRSTVSQDYMKLAKFLFK